MVKKAPLMCFSIFIMLISLMISSLTYASSAPSYDLQNSFPQDPRDYQQVFRPAIVAFDRAGNTYVADVGHHKIIKYDVVGQYVTHWELFNPTAIFIDPLTDHIYVGLFSHKVHIFDDQGRELDSFGESGSGDGAFNWIKDIVVDDQYIYIADRSNHRIQIFNKSDRTLVTILGGSPGTGDGEFNNPSGLAVGSDHQLYVADTYNNRIQLFTFDHGTSTWNHHSNVTIVNPQSMHIQEQAGGAHTLFVFDPSSSASSKWSSISLMGHDLDSVDAASITTHSLDPDVFTGHLNATMTWHPIEEQLYATDQNVIVRLDDEFETSNWIGRSSDQFNVARGMAIDSSNHIYIADTYQHRILKYDQDGTFMESWGKIGSGDGELLQPRGIAVDSLGNIYVADTSNYRIQKFRPDGTFLRKWGERGVGDGKFQEIRSLMIDDNDHVYVASWKTVQKFDRNGNHLLTIGDHLCGTTGHDPCTNPGKLPPSPSGIGIDSTGNVYISAGDYMNKFSSSGTFSARWGGKGTSLGEFDNPGEIAVDDNNRIHVIDTYNRRIQVLKPDGTFLGEYGGYPVTSGTIENIAIDSANQLYVLDLSHYQVKQFKERTPGPISDLSAVGGYEAVTLSFSAPNGASAVVVKHRETGTLPWTNATTRIPITAHSTEALVTGLSEDTEYEFKLEVTGGAHAGDSNIVSVRTYEAPARILDLAAVGGDREVTLTFSPPTGSTSVTVKIWLPGATDWTDATTATPITAASTSATVTGLAEDTYYTFYLQIIGGPRAGTSNSAGVSTNPPPSGAPTPITDLTAAGGDRSVTLTFSAPAGATSVNVKQALHGTGVWTDAATEIPVSAASTRAVVTGLADDTTYDFQLEVVGGDHAGNSNTATATTNAVSAPDSTAPNWPLDSELSISDVTQSSVELSWPAAQDNVAVTGYRIFVDDNLEVDQVSGEYSYAARDGVYSYTLTDLQPDTDYQFTVKAYDEMNNVSDPGLSGTARTLVLSRGTGGGWVGGIWVPSNIADLKQLEIWAGPEPVSLTPTFQPEITEYAVETTASQVEVKAVAEHERAKLEWQEEMLDESSILIELEEGVNVIELTVLAEDRSSKVYTLTILRVAPPLNERDSSQADVVFHDTLGHWAEKQIRDAVKQGIVQGYPDGTFKPNHPVSRAEFAVMLVGVLQLNGEAEGLHFTDQEQVSPWAKRAIHIAFQAGMINGYPDGSFRPNQSVTRAEAAVMLANSLKLQWEDDTRTEFADDDAIPQWARGAVQAVHERGIVGGRGGNLFVPHETTTRAEALVMLLRMME